MYLHFTLGDALNSAIRLILSVGSWLIVIVSTIYALAWLIDNILHRKERYLKAKAERLLIEKNASLNTVTSSSGQIIISTRNGQEWQHMQYLNAATTAIDRYSTPPNQEIELLDALKTVKRCLIVGPSDSGKTTLLSHIIGQAQGETIVIDPQTYPNKWPTRNVVTIRNDDYSPIEDALNELLKRMYERYDDIRAGKIKEGNHPSVTIVIDEWRSIIHHIPSASETIKILLTESRKAAFALFVAGHSDRAKPLGLEGEYDLKDGFALVKLSLENGRRSATLNTGNGDILVRLPGPFDNSQSEDDLFVQLVRGGMSRRKASQEAYGVSYAGAIVDRGKRALGE